MAQFTFTLEADDLDHALDKLATDPTLYLIALSAKYIAITNEAQLCIDAMAAGFHLHTPVLLFNEEGDGQRYHIGTILVEHGIDLDDAKFEELWDQWIDSRGDDEDEPPQDSDFVEWLAESVPGYQVPSVQPTYAVRNERL